MIVTEHPKMLCNSLLILSMYTQTREQRRQHPINLTMTMEIKKNIEHIYELRMFSTLVYIPHANHPHI